MMHPVPKTMAAVQLIGHGGLDKLVYSREVPVPTPAPGEVLVKVTAAGMCRTDCQLVDGYFRKYADLPLPLSKPKGKV